jgi:hypothetical protein
MVLRGRLVNRRNRVSFCIRKIQTVLLVRTVFTACMGHLIFPHIHDVSILVSETFF